MKTIAKIIFVIVGYCALYNPGTLPWIALFGACLFIGSFIKSRVK